MKIEIEFVDKLTKEGIKNILLENMINFNECILKAIQSEDKCLYLESFFSLPICTIKVV